MIVAVELCGCDLHPSAKHERKVIAGIPFQLKLADHQSRSNEGLHATVISPSVVKVALLSISGQKILPI